MGAKPVKQEMKCYPYKYGGARRIGFILISGSALRAKRENTSEADMFVGGSWGYDPCGILTRCLAIIGARSKCLRMYRKIKTFRPRSCVDSTGREVEKASPTRIEQRLSAKLLLGG